ncbi:MAG: transposase [Shewanella sp.]
MPKLRSSIAAEISLECVGDNEVLGTLLNSLRRRIVQVSAGGAYDTTACHKLLNHKDIKAAIPPRSNAGYGMQSMRLKRVDYRNGNCNMSTGKGRWQKLR